MILDMNKIAAEAEKIGFMFNADIVKTLLLTVERLRKVSDAAKAALEMLERQGISGEDSDTINHLGNTLMDAGMIPPLDRFKDAKPLILYFANDEDRAGFVDVAKSVFTNPVEMDVP